MGRRLLLMTPAFLLLTPPKWILYYIMIIFMWSVVTCVDPLGAEAGLASGHFV